MGKGVSVSGFSETVSGWTRPKEAFESSSMTTQLQAAMNLRGDGPVETDTNS